MKVFISGPMTGYKNDNKEAFDNAENLLRENGYDVFNPAWMKFSDEWKREQVLAIDFAAINGCDAIYQLDGWEKSIGAVREYNYALATDKMIISTHMIKK